MPTLKEFTLTLQLRRDEESGTIWTIFRFATVREFRAFQYAIQVEERFDPVARSFAFTIQGVQAPKNLMPSFGNAVRELRYPDLRGSYDVTLTGARRTERFVFEVEADGIALSAPPASEGIRVDVEKGVENIRS